MLAKHNSWKKKESTKKQKGWLNMVMLFLYILLQAFDDCCIRMTTGKLYKRRKIVLGYGITVVILIYCGGGITMVVLIYCGSGITVVVLIYWGGGITVVVMLHLY